MSIRLDPRRLGLLKQLAGEAGVRPGDLVRTWVEERIDGERLGSPIAPTAGVTEQLAAFASRLSAVEAAVGIETPDADAPRGTAPGEPAEGAVSSDADTPIADAGPRDAEMPTADAGPVAAEPTASPEESMMVEGSAGEAGAPDPDAAAGPAATAPRKPRAARNRVSATPPGPRVALHDEMIAVLGERGPMTAGELAAAIDERGRYAPPRSGKPLDAAMVSQRVSNPTYRARFTRRDGRIGLADPGGDDAA